MYILDISRFLSRNTGKNKYFSWYFSGLSRFSQQNMASSRLCFGAIHDHTLYSITYMSGEIEPYIMLNYVYVWSNRTIHGLICIHYAQLRICLEQ